MAQIKEGLILGIGNPLLDITAIVDRNFLRKYDLTSATQMSEKQKYLFEDIIQNKHPTLNAGGSVQNSLKIIQWVLDKKRVTTFFGCVGKDHFADMMQHNAEETGINVHYQVSDIQPTGTCAICICGKERTVCANLGAANFFTIDHLRKPENKKILSKCQYYYISGYFLSVCPPAIFEIAKHSYSHERPFAMCFSARFIVETYMHLITQCIPYIDLLFANKNEAKIFAKEQKWQEDRSKDIAVKMSKLPKKNSARGRIVVLTDGASPVLVAENGKLTVIPIPPIPESRMVDPTGAADAFIGGFLSQFIISQPIEVCVKAAIYAATEVIGICGSTPQGKAHFIP